MRVHEFSLISSTQVKNLHVILVQRLKLGLQHNINQSVSQEDFIEVTDVSSQVIVEALVSLREI